MTRKRLIIIAFLAILAGIIVRVLGPRNGIVLCLVLAVAIYGIKREIEKSKNNEDETNKKEDS